MPAVVLVCLTGSQKNKTPAHSECDVLCVCVLDVEESGVFVSRTLVVVQKPCISQLQSLSDQFPWTTLATLQMLRRFEKMSDTVLFVSPDASDLCVQLCNKRFYIFWILHWVLVSSVRQQKREGPCLQPLEDKEEEEDLDDTIPGTPPAKKVAAFVRIFFF